MKTSAADRTVREQDTSSKASGLHLPHGRPHPHNPLPSPILARPSPPREAVSRSALVGIETLSVPDPLTTAASSNPSASPPDGDGSFKMPTEDRPPSTNSSPLPSFYSPRPTAVDAADTASRQRRRDGDARGGDSDHHGQDNPNRHNGGEQDLPKLAFPPIDSLSLSAPDAATRSSTASSTSSPSTSAAAGPPPPSLVSPAFTPPRTPGTQTPTAGLRGVPVDSTSISGGCGTKKPRLLETLPEVECLVRARIPTVAGGEMFLHLYSNNIDEKEHLAIVFGRQIRSRSLEAPREGETELDRMIRGAYVGALYPGRTSSRETAAEDEAAPSAGAQTQSANPPLVRIHSECYTGETAWSARCDCGEQLDEAARLMSLPGNTSGGIIIYLRQEGRGIGLGEKLKAYNLQDLGSDTVEANLLLRHPADARSYGLATAMLLDLGQSEIRLLTNNPDKIRAVEGPGREVVVKERVAMVPLSWKGEGGFKSREVEGYLKTKVRPPWPLSPLPSFAAALDFSWLTRRFGRKIEKMGHMLERGGAS